MGGAARKLLEKVEQRRRAVSAELSARQRASLGQFFTPPSAATFLAELLDLPRRGTLRLLDPGAGVGSLSAAVVARVLDERPDLAVHIVAFEIDDPLVPHLTDTLHECRTAARARGTSVEFEVRHSSFIEYATGRLLEQPAQFDAVIVNPPYRKVNTKAPERVAAQARGLRAGNLYTIFTGLAADLLADRGQMSVIIPRSWANGPYHEPFRRFLLDRVSIDFLHVYEDRGEVFADAEVLQENVVLHATRGPQSGAVTLSTSSAASSQRVERRVNVEEVLHPADPNLFVRIPIDARATRVADQIAGLPSTLPRLDLSVSTGRVVDFRARASLRQDPDRDTVPLIYPGHLRNGRIEWPALGSKKPNALHRSEFIESLLLPNETFVLVKRFSAKEERRRVSAAVAQGADLPGDAVGYENHLNVYHRRGRGLPLPLALGLSVYLNSTLVDEYVRSFSGHTQINATDLRQLRYPAESHLVRLGEKVSLDHWPAQAELDALLAECVLDAADSPGELQAA